MKTLLLKNYFQLRRCVFSFMFVSNLSKQSRAFISMADLSPPLSVRGMKTLDRSLFNLNVSVPCIVIRPELVKMFTTEFKHILLKLPNLKAVRPAEDSDRREILLDPKLVSKSEDVEKMLKTLGLQKSHLGSRELILSYSNWTVDEVLKAILPEKSEIAAGYSLVGHIVHLNLRDHLIEYKNVIGEILLDKIKQAQTVVNKIDMVDGTFRVFKMEVLAGESNFVTEVKENSFSYKFDFSKAYWNPRLATEHERIVKKMNAGDVLFDVFAGVGPFSIPAARKKCTVLANDLNPESFKWLQYNSKLNKVEHSIKTFNKDGTDFIKEDVKTYMLHKKPETKSHIVMNLPAIAVKFLRGFKNMFLEDQMEDIGQLPTVHVYCFVKGDGDPKGMAKCLVEQELNCSLPTVDEIFLVRNVAPNKDMMRVSFQLTRSIVQSDVEKPRMAKGGNSKKKNKNVFKVAGSRTLKAKNKAKPVTSHLKQQTQSTKIKTEEINKMLAVLQEPVRKSQSLQVEKKIPSDTNVNNNKQKDVEVFEKIERDSEIAVDQLNKISF